MPDVVVLIAVSRYADHRIGWALRQLGDPTGAAAAWQRVADRAAVAPRSAATRLCRDGRPGRSPPKDRALLKTGTTDPKESDGSGGIRLDSDTVLLSAALVIVSCLLVLVSVSTGILAWRARSEAEALRARYASIRDVEAEVERLRRRISAEERAWATRRTQLEAEWLRRPPLAEEEQWTERFPRSDEGSLSDSAAVLWQDSATPTPTP